MGAAVDDIMSFSLKAARIVESNTQAVVTPGAVVVLVRPSHRLNQKGGLEQASATVSQQNVMDKFYHELGYGVMPRPHPVGVVGIYTPSGAV